MQLYDETQKETLDYINTLLRYFEMCQNGRVKPNTKNNSGGGGEATIRDSIDNVPELEAIKDKLNKLLNLNLELIDGERNKIILSKSSSNKVSNHYLSGKQIKF